MLNEGAHTSTKAFWNSFITQWYLNISGAEQFWIAANDVQFFRVARFATSDLVFGQELTTSRVWFDQTQYLLSEI